MTRLFLLIMFILVSVVLIVIGIMTALLILFPQPPISPRYDIREALFDAYCSKGIEATIYYKPNKEGVRSAKTCVSASFTNTTLIKLEPKE